VVAFCENTDFGIGLAKLMGEQIKEQAPSTNIFNPTPDDRQTPTARWRTWEEQAKSILEAAQSEQQQFVDAMAESLKHGRRGQDAEASLKALQEAIDQVQEAIDRVDMANEQRLLGESGG
jgi:hypothetical protein